MDLSLGLDPLGALDSVLDISGNQARADASLASTEKWNKIKHNMDQEKMWFSQQQYRDAVKYRDNYFKNIVKSANDAGVSVSQALGASGSTPVTVGIPGTTGARVAGNGRSSGMSGITAQMAIANQTEKTRAHNAALEQQFQSDLAYWNSKQAELEYNRSVDPSSKYPKKYQLYEDNQAEAEAHIRAGGFAVPANSSMELPESVGAYHFSKPYLSSEKIDLRVNPNKYNIGVMP